MIHIEEAKGKDLIDVAKLILTNFVKEINANIPQLESDKDVNYEKFLEYYMDMAKRKVPHCVFIAKDGDNIVGASGGHLNVHHWGNSIWGVEDYWYIDKEHRGGSAGHRLYKKLQEWFEDSGCTRISMTHYAWSPNIGEYYKRDGYVPYDTNYVKEIKNGSCDW